MPNTNTQPIRNIRAFVDAYLSSKSGLAALARSDSRYYDKDTKKFVTVQRSSAMADAFQLALTK